ncbi:FtsK/SpoIIIE domain-containing protein [Arthrobacter sp. TMN-37]
MKLVKHQDVLDELIEHDAVRIVFQFGALGPLVQSNTVNVLRFARAHCDSGEIVEVSPTGGRAQLQGEELFFSPDGVGSAAFERTARALGLTTQPTEKPRIRADADRFDEPPASVDFWVTTPGQNQPLMESDSVKWHHRAPVNQLRTQIGATSRHPVEFDLVRDGPHLLVAGTTGSGKSEFLRSFVLGLASNYSPERLAFLLIDYKGGSGLADLSGLPHTAGTLTDLSAESTSRFLTSLRAELRRREALCALHQAEDLQSLYQKDSRLCPPRLVVVIDELKALSDEVPSAIGRLIEIGSLGRSFGVHLVLATQRPQGTVTPDLRANITSCVLFRVQTVLESQDLLDSSVAAAISVSRPGRAYLRVASRPPVCFQASSTSISPFPTQPMQEERIGWTDLRGYLRPVSAGTEVPITPEGPGRTYAQQTPLRMAVGRLAEGARAQGYALPQRPVLPPLPRTLAGDDRFLPTRPSNWRKGRGAQLDPEISLGLMDLPADQDQQPLRWWPARDSHLAVVGLPGSGGAQVLQHTVSTLLLMDPDVHVYLLDGDLSLEFLSQAPQVGAYVHPWETKRAARVLERIAGNFVTTRAPTGQQLPTILLAVSAWGHWSDRFRNGRFARAEEDLQSIARTPSPAALILTGDRELITSRFFSLLPNRVYLTFGAQQETRMSWPPMPEMDNVPGRGFAQGPVAGARPGAICQLVVNPNPVPPVPDKPSTSPVHVLPLPSLVEARALSPCPKSIRGPDATGFAIGLSGDELEQYYVDLSPGTAFLALGPRSSGKTNLVWMFAWAAGLHPSQRQAVIHRGQGAENAARFWRSFLLRPSARQDAERNILLIDDVDNLPDDVQLGLVDTVAQGSAAVVTAQGGPSLLSRVPLAARARSTGTGIILRPRPPADGDFFGLRFDITESPPLGRGLVCGRGEATEVQLARCPEDLRAH